VENRLRTPKRSVLLVLVVATALLAPGTGYATTKIPYAAPVRHAVETAFLEGGVPSPAKIQAYRSYLEDKRTWLERHSFDFRRRIQRQGRQRSREAAASSDFMRTLGHALEFLDELEATSEPAESYRLGVMILTLDYSTRAFHYPLGSIQLPIYIRNMLVDWSVDAHTRPGDGIEEATNLVDPASGEFYTPAELDAMIERGEDISRLDPPSDGMLWRSTGDISRLDIRANYLGMEGSAQHEGIPAVFPADGDRTQLRRLQLTQTKPKIHVFWLDPECRAKPPSEHEACRRQYKIRVGSELHADPVVNSLMAALGYNHDVSLFIRNLRIDLGETTRPEIARDWANYFDMQHLWTRTPLDRGLLPGEAGHGHDEHGEYLVFQAAGIQSQPKELTRVGDWSNGRIDPGAVAIGMREARGLAMFNVWVANTDLKDAENNKLILRDYPSGEWRIFLSQQDTGNSLGRVLAEKADAFPWDAVETDWVQRGFGTARGRIELNYFALQNSGVYDNATHADHRWMLRKVAQLTREQIEDAVSLGRFPGGIGQLYVEKLIARRNQLVQFFGLADEFDPIPVDRRITTADGSVVRGRLVEGDFPEETIVDLGNHWSSLIRPMGPELWRHIRVMAAQGISAFDSAGAEIDLSGSLELYPDLLINLGREVVPNPSARGPLDQFIIEDTMTIGGRLAIGYIGRAGGSFRRRYRLAYTAPSVWEAKLHDNQALNWFLAGDVKRGDLPESFVLMRTEEWGPGLSVGTNDPFELTPGADLSLDWLKTQRTVVARRPDSTRIWRDAGQAVRGQGRAWLKLFLPRITLWQRTLEAGTLAGELYELDGAISSDEVLSQLLDGDAPALAARAVEPPRATDVAYSTFTRNLNLMFFGWHRRDREDRLALTSASGVGVGEQFQTSHRRGYAWSFLDNGESFSHHVEGILDRGFTGADTEEPVVVASYLIDDRNAKNDELDAYHHFLAGLGGERRLLAAPFHAADWEQVQSPGGRWGRLLVEGQLVLRGKALDELQALDEAAYWRDLGAALGRPTSELAAIRAGLTSGSHRERQRLRSRTPLGRRTAVRSAHNFFASLERARLAEDPEERVKELAQALQHASFRMGGSFEPVVLQTALRQLGFRKHERAGTAGARLRIRKAFEDEVIFPDNRDIVGRRGNRSIHEQLDVVVEPFDPLELFTMLDWAWGDTKTYFIAPEALRRPVR
jgi:hypothetical protein